LVRTNLEKDIKWKRVRKWLSNLNASVGLFSLEWWGEEGVLLLA
jgi:hypothetical protein